MLVDTLTHTASNIHSTTMLSQFHRRCDNQTCDNMPILANKNRVKMEIACAYAYDNLYSPKHNR